MLSVDANEGAGERDRSSRRYDIAEATYLALLRARPSPELARAADEVAAAATAWYAAVGQHLQGVNASHAADPDELFNAERDDAIAETLVDIWDSIKLAHEGNDLP
jgi:hypothetical protein